MAVRYADNSTLDRATPKRAINTFNKHPPGYQCMPFYTRDSTTPNWTAPTLKIDDRSNSKLPARITVCQLDFAIRGGARAAAQSKSSQHHL